VTSIGACAHVRRDGLSRSRPIAESSLAVLSAFAHPLDRAVEGEQYRRWTVPLPHYRT
jgi:hypothetical protein